MANRAKNSNIANHKRQMWYLQHGIVMLPTLAKERKLRKLAKQIHDEVESKEKK